jgi:hypothetical protein
VTKGKNQLKSWKTWRTFSINTTVSETIKPFPCIFGVNKMDRMRWNICKTNIKQYSSDVHLTSQRQKNKLNKMKLSNLKSYKNNSKQLLIIRKKHSGKKKCKKYHQIWNNNRQLLNLHRNNQLKKVKRLILTFLKEFHIFLLNKTLHGWLFEKEFLVLGRINTHRLNKIFKIFT